MYSIFRFISCPVDVGSKTSQPAHWLQSRSSLAPKSRPGKRKLHSYELLAPLLHMQVVYSYMWEKALASMTSPTSSSIAMRYSGSIVWLVPPIDGAGTCCRPIARRLLVVSIWIPCSANYKYDGFMSHQPDQTRFWLLVVVALTVYSCLFWTCTRQRNFHVDDVVVKFTSDVTRADDQLQCLCDVIR